MDPAIAARLVALNHTFYEKLSAPFARTRAHFQPGFQALLDFLPGARTRVLDVGCGEGRFGRFLAEQEALTEYVGVDFSPALIEKARLAFLQGTVPIRFQVRDLGQPRGSLQGLGLFGVVACLAVLQHLPGRENRIDLLREMKEHLAPGGRLVLSTWQFLESERQRRKIAPWEAADLKPEAVDDNDYLLTWQSGGFGLRYVAFINANEMKDLAGEAGLEVVAQFRDDGREGNLNLYSVLRSEP